MLATALCPVVEIRTGSLSGKICPVEGTLRIGRHPANVISVADPSVSRYHATVEVMQDGVYVIDLESTNGTFINDIKVFRKLLVLTGDVIRVGETEFVFRDE